MLIFLSSSSTFSDNTPTIENPEKQAPSQKTPKKGRKTHVIQAKDSYLEEAKEQACALTDKERALLALPIFYYVL